MLDESSLPEFIFRIQEKLGSILFLGLPLARRFQMDVWVEMSLDGQKQDMSCSDVFHVMKVALLVAGFCRHFPNGDPSDQRDDFGHHDEKDELIHLKIYKIWGEQIKTFHVDLCPDVFMIMFLRWLLGSWMKLSWERDAEDDARHSVWTTLDTRPTRKREHDQKGHKPGSSRPRRGVKTHLEECTTRYLGFKMLFVFRVQSLSRSKGWQRYFGPCLCFCCFAWSFWKPGSVLLKAEVVW